MPEKVIVVAIHGMGDTPKNFAKGLLDDLEKRLGHDVWRNRILPTSIYYQKLLQTNQRRVMTAMKRADIDWIKMRQFMLYGFSDASGLERRADMKDSPYHQAQKIIRNTLGSAYDQNGGKAPVVIIAQSLGGQVISNYIWDAQQSNPSQGTWKHDPAETDPNRDSFLRLKTLKFFYTTGCNIPIFVSGFPKEKIKAIKTSTSGYRIQWKNLYDPDDVLGWPLKPLSPTYKVAVTRDIPINAAGSLLGMIGQSWNPFSHRAYWKDGDVLRPLRNDIRSLL